MTASYSIVNDSSVDLGVNSKTVQIRPTVKAVHIMATANLKKSEEFVTNTTTASKYIPRRPGISIN